MAELTRYPQTKRSAIKRFRGSAARSAGSATPQELAQFFRTRAAANPSVGNPYQNVSTVYACVKAKANALVQLELRVSDRSDQVIEDGPLVQLMARPNRRQSRRDLLKALSSWLDLFGEVFLVKRLSANQVDAFFVVSPIEMTELKHAGEAVAYQYAPINGGIGEVFTPEQVHVIREPNYGSGDLTRALGVKQAASLAISQHYQSDVANDQSLRVGAGGGLGLRTEANLTDAQRDQLDRDLNSRYSGANNRHKWMLLEGAMSVERLYSTFAEMEFVDLKYYSREDICVAFGLNPLVLGYGGREGLGSGQHTEAAHEITWNNTYLPRAAWIAEELTHAIVPHAMHDRSLRMRDARRRAIGQRERRQTQYQHAKDAATGSGLGYMIWFDASAVSVLQRASLELAKQAKEWIDVGVPLNQTLAAFDLPFEDVAWGDTWWRPFGLVDVQDQEAGGIGGQDDRPGPDDELTDDELADDPDDADRAAGINQDAFDHIKRLTEPQKASLWQQWRASWAGIEQQFRRKHQALISSWRKQTLSNLFRLVPDVKAMPGVQRRDLIGQVLFDLVDADRLANGRLGPLVRAAFVLGGEQALTEAAAAEDADPSLIDPFNIADPLVQQSIRSREVRIRDTTRTTRRRVANTLAAGIDNSETVQQLAERIRKEFNFASSRAKTIARDHVGGAVEDARHQGRRQAGTPAKSWLWSRKETGRPWHMETEQQTLAEPIANDALFVLPKTGGRTPYPRGSGLTAEDTANCACTTIARWPGDTIKDARAIAHLIERGFITDRQLATLARRQPAKDAA